MPPRRFLSAIVTIAALAAATPQVHAADPGYYVVTVYDDPGLRTIDLRYWSVQLDGRHAVLWPELGLGYNSGRWYTELIASWIAGRDLPTHLSHVEWQNELLLTQGQYPVDIAIHTLLAQAHGSAQLTTIEFGPALQTDIGRTQLNGNVFLERSFAPQQAHPMQLKYQWQLRHRWLPGLHVGAQGFGELGPWNDWSDHPSHRAGPALFGSVPVGGDAKVSWQAAWLFGKVYAQRGSMLTARVKLDF